MIEIFFPSQATWAQITHWLVEHQEFTDGFWQNEGSNPIWKTYVTFQPVGAMVEMALAA